LRREFNCLIQNENFFSSKEKVNKMSSSNSNMDEEMQTTLSKKRKQREGEGNQGGNPGGYPGGYQGMFETIQGQINKKMKTVEELVNTVEKNKFVMEPEDYKEFQKQINSYVKEIVEEMKKLEGENTELTETNNNLQGENQNLEQANETAKTNLQQCLNELSTLKSQIVVLEQQISEKTNENKSLQQQIDVKEQKKEDCDQEINNLNDQIVELNQNIVTLGEERTIIVNEINKYLEAVLVHETEIEEKLENLEMVDFNAMLEEIKVNFSKQPEKEKEEEETKFNEVIQILANIKQGTATDNEKEKLVRLTACDIMKRKNQDTKYKCKEEDIPPPIKMFFKSKKDRNQKRLVYSQAGKSNQYSFRNAADLTIINEARITQIRLEDIASSRTQTYDY